MARAGRWRFNRGLIWFVELNRERTGEESGHRSRSDDHLYNQIGVNADKELMAPGARPIEIVNGGKIVKDLLA